MQVTTEMKEIVEQLDQANRCIIDGDPEPWKALVSHRDDVTLLGAYGGHVRGWDEVSVRFDRVATTYGGGGMTRRQNISTWVDANLACVVDLEHHQARLDGATEPACFVYRTTHVLRREDGVWRVVLRHADPVGSFRGPQFAHHDAQDAAAGREWATAPAESQIRRPGLRPPRGAAPGRSPSSPTNGEAR